MSLLKSRHKRVFSDRTAASGHKHPVYECDIHLVKVRWSYVFYCIVYYSIDP